MSSSLNVEPSEAYSPAIPKALTRVQGVDYVLGGGLPGGQTTLIAGGPGTGKTILALEQLYRAACAGEPGILVTFEESAEAIRRHARALGWDLEAQEREGRLSIMDVPVPVDAVQSGDFDLGGLLAVLQGQIRELGARRLVIDAVDVLLRLFRDRTRREDQLFALNHWLTSQDLTSVVTVKAPYGASEPLSKLEYLADCVILLDQRVIGQVTTRRFRVSKYRGSGFESNEFPYFITSGGIVLMPVSEAAFSERPIGSKFSTGNAPLDRLLDGGLAGGSCILLGGASGTGKTTLACSIAVAAAGRKERVLYLSFDEGVEWLVSAMKSPGIALGSAMDSGHLRIMTAMPEAMGAEGHLWRIFRAVDEFEPAHLVVDTISACGRMGSEKAAFDFLLRLMAHCRSRGITCLYLSQTDPEHTIHKISGIGISSVVDVLLVLEQDWTDDTHRRRLLILKARGSRHSHAPHTFRITDSGIVIEEAGKAPDDARGAAS